VATSKALLTARFALDYEYIQKSLGAVDDEQGIKWQLVSYNDFVNNEIHTFFDGSLFNNWNRNYWSDSRWIIIKPIIGKLDLYDIPWINFDFSPSRNIISNK